MKYGKITVDFPKTEPDPTVKKVFIRRNVWDNYAIFIGTRKVYDAGDKRDIVDYIEEKYPNAEVIDKTIKH